LFWIVLFWLATNTTARWRLLIVAREMKAHAKLFINIEINEIPMSAKHRNRWYRANIVEDQRACVVVTFGRNQLLDSEWQYVMEQVYCCTKVRMSGTDGR